MPQPTLSFLTLFLSQAHVLYPQRHRRHYIFICHNELLSKAQEACSFPFHCFHQWHPVPFLSPCCWLCSWLCPICISFSLSSTCLQLTPVIHYCNLSPVTCSFLKLSVQYVLCLWLSLLSNLSMTSFSDLCVCVCVLWPVH